MKHGDAKALIRPWQEALYNFAEDKAGSGAGSKAGDILRGIAGDAKFRMCYPFGDFSGSDAFYEAVFLPLARAMQDLERRDTITIAGLDEHGKEWVGCCGYYLGSFLAPWLDIPPTGHLAHMRFHEFYQVQHGKVVEFQAIWDIPELMMQASAWPLAPSLGREWHVPAPATQDGLFVSGTDQQAQATRDHVLDMLKHLERHPTSGPETMEMERFWHENMTWYGPAGIGTCRGIAGFRHWHQIPFLSAMPDRGQNNDQITYHFFAEGEYAAVTGWPDMLQSLTAGGWLGIPPLDKKVSLRSLDFWRLEQGKIRENWVLVDLLDVYDQIGVDVFARLREFNKARNLSPIEFRKDY